MKKETGLDVAVLSAIIKKISGHKSVEKIVLYGSRARGDFKPTSDIDVAILAPSWTSQDLNIVKDMLEESVKTPLKFDVVLFDDLKKSQLKQSILAEGKVLYESGKN